MLKINKIIIFFLGFFIIIISTLRASDDIFSAAGNIQANVNGKTEEITITEMGSALKAEDYRKVKIKINNIYYNGEKMLKNRILYVDLNEIKSFSQTCGINFGFNFKLDGHKLIIKDSASEYEFKEPYIDDGHGIYVSVESLFKGLNYTCVYNRDTYLLDIYKNLSFRIIKSTNNPSNSIFTSTNNLPNSSVTSTNNPSNSSVTLLKDPASSAFQEAIYWVSRGMALCQQNYYEEAVKCYDKALEFDPQNIYALTKKGWALCYQGKYEESVRCCNKALEIDPQNASIWDNLGCAFQGAGNSIGYYCEEKVKCYQEAIKCFDKALEIEPKNTAILASKGGALREQYNYEESIKCFEKIIEINPLDAIAWLRIGQNLLCLNNYKEAIKYFDKALTIRPDDREALAAKEQALKALSPLFNY